MNSNKRWIGVVVAVALAAVGTFVLIQYVNSADDRALAGQETIEVLTVSQAVSAGTPAEELTATVETALIPAKTQVPGSVASLDQLVGTVAAVDLVPGEQLLLSRFIEPDVFESQDDFELPDGLVEVTVSLSPERAVGGALKQGDLVAVLASFEPFELDGTEPSDGGDLPTEIEDVILPGSDNEKPTTPNTTGLIIHKVVVTNVQVERLPTEPEEGAADTTDYSLAPTGNLLVTLGMAPANAERLIFTAEFGTMWLAGEQDTTPEGGTLIQTRNTVYQSPVEAAR